MGSVEFNKTIHKSKVHPNVKATSKGQRLNWGKLSDASFNIVDEKGTLVISNTTNNASKLLVP